MKNILNFSIFIVSSIICSFLIPNPYNSIKLNQKSSIDIYAPYDFKVYKKQHEMKTESLSVLSRVYPVLIYQEHKIESKNKSSLFEFVKLEIEKYLNVGVLSNEDYNFLKNDPSEKVAIYINGEIYEKNKNNLFSFSNVYDTIISQVSMVYPDSIEKIKMFLLEYLKPNLTLDLNLTNYNRNSALASIKDYKYEVRKGELIIRRGEIVNEEVYKKIKAIYQSKDKLMNGTLILILFIAWAGVNVSRRNISFSNNIIINIAIVLLATFHGIIINFGYPYTLNLSPFFSLLLSFIVPKQIAINFATTSSIILGVFYNMDFLAFIWTLIISLSTILLTNFIKRRFEIMFIAIFTIPIAILLQSILRKFEISLNDILFIITSISISLILAILSLMIIEKLTRLTTTFNLIDLANLEHPLIQQLRDKAPGTYNHSLNVSLLAQEAAEELGANALLCKVGAYFHDIGKIKNPQYFVENQTGYNPHDELDPIQSAKIVIEHVNEGIKLAKKYGIPNAIIDIIKTHHGTTILEPFYKKALLIDPKVDKKLFQYPGPNPRTREEAIVMLADAVEAAVRSLKEKDRESIKNLARAIINDRWEKGYLENTDLKKKDLEKIEQIFVRVLESIYHPRIAYD